MSAALRTGRPRGRPPFAYRINARFTESQLEFLEAMADRTDRPLASVIRQCVAEAMRRQQKAARSS